MSENVASIFLATCARKGDTVAARFKKDGAWRTYSWKELEGRARAIAAGLILDGVQAGDRVNILGSTSIDWVLAELGVHLAGATSVPIYHSNTPDEVQYVVENSGGSYAFVDGPEQLAKFEEIKARIPAVKRVVRWDAAGEGDWIRGVEDLMSAGEGDEGAKKTLEERIEAIDPDLTAVIIYTSGTTGPPKGVILPHSAWAYEAKAVEKLNLVEEDDIQMFWLPLAHSFAQVLKTAWYHLGHEMAFAESIERLVPNLAEARPTVMACVPRIFEKVFTKVISGGLESPGIKGKLFAWAMGHFDRYADAKRKGQEYGGVGFALANKLVFSKVAEKLSGTFGGRMRFFLSGGAPLSPTIAYFFDIAGIMILEGYGLTETSAATCVNLPHKIKIGTVGPAIPGSELKIAADGEIMIRGPGVMKGYYGNEEATKEAFDAEGWFHSGDIGELDADGYLKITDRKKDIIVTAGGKNVAPQNIENQLKTAPLVSQVVVHGDKRKFLSALFTLDEENAKALAAKEGLGDLSIPELAKHPRIREEIQKHVDAVNAGLASYETVKKFAILEADFTQESGELTASLKVKRRVVEKGNQAILDAFYGESY
ncbi:MAG: AMP-dependent synthetase/ligase [Deltaproteobacteria bacterium]|nr:AMP-dependent synthetase/ligase [Deltaproteobacteria bacterium]